MAEEIKYGIINEIGDMGLGYDDLTPEENKKVNEAVDNKQTKKDKKEER
jgi:hypothetical protein